MHPLSSAPTLADARQQVVDVLGARNFSIPQLRAVARALQSATIEEIYRIIDAATSGTRANGAVPVPKVWDPFAEQRELPVLGAAERTRTRNGGSAVPSLVLQSTSDSEDEEIDALAISKPHVDRVQRNLTGVKRKRELLRPLSRTTSRQSRSLSRSRSRTRASSATPAAPVTNGRDEALDARDLLLRGSAAESDDELAKTTKCKRIQRPVKMRRESSSTSAASAVKNEVYFTPQMMEGDAEGIGDAAQGSNVLHPNSLRNKKNKQGETIQTICSWPNCEEQCPHSPQTPYRKVVSDCFGRNIAALQGDVPWIYVCRRRYQRQKYAGPQLANELRALMFIKQLELWQDWGGFSLFEVQHPPNFSGDRTLDDLLEYAKQVEHAVRVQSAAFPKIRAFPISGAELRKEASTAVHDEANTLLSLSSWQPAKPPGYSRQESETLASAPAPSEPKYLSRPWKIDDIINHPIPEEEEPDPILQTQQIQTSLPTQPTRPTPPDLKSARPSTSPDNYTYNRPLLPLPRPPSVGAESYPDSTALPPLGSQEFMRYSSSPPSPYKRWQYPPATASS